MPKGSMHGILTYINGCFFCKLLLMEKKMHHLRCTYHPANDGIFAKHQLVSLPDFWLPSTVVQLNRFLQQLVGYLSNHLLYMEIPMKPISFIKYWLFERNPYNGMLLYSPMSPILSKTQRRRKRYCDYKPADVFAMGLGWMSRDGWKLWYING